jgi:hypothetical protein
LAVYARPNARKFGHVQQPGCGTCPAVLVPFEHFRHSERRLRQRYDRPVRTLMSPGDDEFDHGPSEPPPSARELTIPAFSADFNRTDVQRGWGGAPAAGIVTLVTLVADGVKGLFGLARRRR